ncbi:hypothetical protein [Roseisolibacter sp. H3M3-2]|uniref:hypothetical protein n=1 Tax=Roseisolibacter sp. H3M3-2 TaxID=3031323 RepID=UPI0023DB29C7|nr:hypothetical protein [Roseisolibacter sp. H3M3-2]MDF1506334.1 hypothetical protein [Roseisolibacter sp. H3M3-2]
MRRAGDPAHDLREGVAQLRHHAHHRVDLRRLAGAARLEHRAHRPRVERVEVLRDPAPLLEVERRAQLGDHVVRLQQQLHPLLDPARLGGRARAA